MGKTIVVNGTISFDRGDGKQEWANCRLEMTPRGDEARPILPDAERWALMPKKRTYTDEVLLFIEECVTSGKSRAEAARFIREIEEALAKRRAEFE